MEQTKAHLIYKTERLSDVKEMHYFQFRLFNIMSPALIMISAFGSSPSNYRPVKRKYLKIIAFLELSPPPHPLQPSFLFSVEVEPNPAKMNSDNSSSNAEDIDVQDFSRNQLLEHLKSPYSIYFMLSTFGLIE